MAYDAYQLAKSDGKRAKTPALASSLAKLLEFETSPNIAEMILDREDGDAELEQIGQDVEREYKIDKKSREEWEQSAERAMDIALQVRKPKNYPFEGAANIKYPLVTVAALQFGARAYPAIVDGNRIVKAQVMGRDDGVPLSQPGMTPPAMGGPGELMGSTAMTPPDPMAGQMQGAGGAAMGQMPPEMQMGQPGMEGQQQQQQQWQVPPGAKRAKADRVSAHMSYQLLCEMEEWEEDTDVLLHHLPIVGCAFRKVWRSEELGRNKAEMVPAIHLVVNNKVRNLEEAPRVTHEIFLYPQEIEERKRSGTFLEVDLQAPPSEGDSDDDAPHCFLEQHKYLDLDGDGYKEPYIVTVHKDDCKVVRIVANFRVEDIKDDGKHITRIPKGHYFVKYSFIPDPKGGFYDIGFGKLLESIGESIDTTINQMLDAGHLQNAGGGFIGSGVRLKKNDIKIKPGTFEQVQVTGDLRASILHHQFPGPSPVLFNLLGMLIEAARDITAVKDILTGDTGDKGVQTATTTLAMIEQGLKVFTAIYKRVYRAMRDEFKLLFALNAQHLDDETYFTFHDQQQAVAKSDYDVASMDIMPVADPKMVTDMQRSARANVLMQIAGSPLGAALNPQEALKRVFDSLGMEEAEKLIAQQQGPPPDLMAKVEKDMTTAELNKAKAEKTKVETDLLDDEAQHAALMAEADLTLRSEDQQHRQNVERAGIEIDAASRADEAQRADRQQQIDTAMGLTAAQQAEQQMALSAQDSERNFEISKAKASQKASA